MAKGVDIAELRTMLMHVRLQMVKLPLQLATSNSWRRIVDANSFEVISPITQRDGHPDLASNSAVMDYVLEAANTLPALLDELDTAQQALRAVPTNVHAHDCAIKPDGPPCDCHCAVVKAALEEEQS